MKGLDKQTNNSQLTAYFQVGYYMIRDPREKFPKVVYCDMNLQEEETGFQRSFGSPGNLRHFSAFDVSLRWVEENRAEFIKFIYVKWRAVRPSDLTALQPVSIAEKMFVRLAFFSSQPFYDDYRYINFTNSGLNTGNDFNLRDGIFKVPHTGRQF